MADGTIFAVVFPFLFVGVWLFVTTILGCMSGWIELQDAFPDRDEVPEDRLRFQSGSLGSGSLANPWGNVSYGSCLKLDACRSGLRVSISKIFGPFLRPFFVPWDRISVERKRTFIFDSYALGLGSSGRNLTIGKRAYRRIAAVAPTRFGA